MDASEAKCVFKKFVSSYTNGVEELAESEFELAASGFQLEEVDGI
jgi:hypothetical protein